MSILDDWVSAATSALGLPADAIPADLRTGLLDVTRDAAHGVTRVAGPLTTYLIGLAVGAGMDSAAALRAVADAVSAATAGVDQSSAEVGESASAGPGSSAAGDAAPVG